MQNKTSFVPVQLNPAKWEELEILFSSLKQREIQTADELATWLEDFSQLSAVISEYGSRCSIEKACHTDDPRAEKRFLHFVEEISPRVKPLVFELEKKFLACEHRKQMADKKFGLLEREWAVEVEIFRPENIDLQTQVTKLASEYDKLCGAMMVEFQGTTHTMQQMARFSEQQDRAIRESAYRAAEQRRLQDRQSIDTLFDGLMGLRNQIATNAGLNNFREYAWKTYGRFDYTPQDCRRFAEAIEKWVVPVVEKLNEKRKHDLRVGQLRPWDLQVDVQGRQALKPFDPNHIDDFVHKTKAVFDQVSPKLGEMFGRLKMQRNLDLESRAGKRPGGFQSSLEVIKEPFIFMNAAGLHRDVETMLHEAGHAFHYQQACREELVFVRHAPIEFCEVASMSMELIGGEYLHPFYESSQDRLRAKQQHLEGIIRILPWIACIDQFQHSLYHSTAVTSAQERQNLWLNLYSQFSSKTVDWQGLENSKAALWQRQIHLFSYPFYYIEYGIAQLGALQVWQNYKQDRQQALESLLQAFALGGTRPLPKLFEAAGIQFDFSQEILRPLMAMVEQELGLS